jgi:hypothetical protein
MNCPKCKSADVRLSKTPSWRDVFQRVQGREAFRCRDCRARFFAREAPGAETDAGAIQKSKQIAHFRGKSRRTRQILIISVFAVAFVVFFYILRYLTTERTATPADDSGLMRSYQVASQG